jgi:acetolactate synthase-1/3 small subunit
MTPEPFARSAGAEAVTEHVLSVLVENKSGVLSRVAGLFSRRGFNITSLTVAPTSADDRFSRFTIVVDAESAPIEQVVGQLNKLINVVDIRHLSREQSVERELLLATVPLDETNRGDILKLVAYAGAAVIDFSTTAVTISLASAPVAIDQFEASLRELHAQIEVQRTGRVALPRLTPPA